MRRVTIESAPPGRSSFVWIRQKPRRAVVKNWFLLRMSQTFQFSQPIKQFFLRLMGVKIGRDVQIMPDVFFDIFFPELITIEDEVIIGISAFISCHEFIPREYHYGPVLLKKGSLIGAKAFVLPGVIVGENSFVSPLTTVYKDIPDNVLAFGSPLQFMPRQPRNLGDGQNKTQQNKINVAQEAKK